MLDIPSAAPAGDGPPPLPRNAGFHWTGGGVVAVVLVCWLSPVLMSWKLTIFIGLALIGFAGWLAQREHAWLKAARVVPGTVAELIPVRGSKGSTSYKPRVRYTTPDGAIHDFVRGYASKPAGLEVGERLAVAYRDDAPQDLRILTFGQRFGFAAFIAVFGVCLVLLGAAFLAGSRLVPRIYTGGQALNTPSKGW